MRGVRRAGAVGAVTAVVGVVLAACGGGAPTVTPSSGAPSSEATESATPSESATPTETESEVLPANDVKDPLEALQAIWDYYDYLAANPDPDKLELIFHPECDCYPDVHALLERLHEDGGRIEVEEREISGTELLSQSQRTAEVRMRRVVKYHLVTADGEAAETQEAEQAGRWLLLLGGGRWVIREFLGS